MAACRSIIKGERVFDVVLAPKEGFRLDEM